MDIQKKRQRNNKSHNECIKIIEEKLKKYHYIKYLGNSGGYHIDKDCVYRVARSGVGGRFYVLNSSGNESTFAVPRNLNYTYIFVTDEYAEKNKWKN